MITKHWNIWYIVRGGWVGFYCFLTNSFEITFKYLQNIVILCFLFVKFPWEKDNMLRADEDGRMLFLHNEFFSNIFKYKWNRETGHLLTKIFNLANILNCRANFFTNLEAVESRSRSLWKQKPWTSEYWWIVWIKKIWKS